MYIYDSLLCVCVCERERAGEGERERIIGGNRRRQRIILRGRFRADACGLSRRDDDATTRSCSFRDNVPYRFA